MSQKFLNPVEVNGQVSAEYLDLSTSTSHSVNAGEIAWNSIDGTFDIGLLNGVTLQTGQEMHFYGKATEAISNGNAVMFAGVQGDHILIAKADAVTINANPEYFMGVATQDFATNDFGYVTAFGNVRGIDTSTYTLGDILYYDSTTSTDGLLTPSMPSAPNAKIIVAAVVKVHATQGILAVRPHTMPRLKDIQDINVDAATTGEILQLRSTGVWENKTLSEAGIVSGSGTTNYVSKFTSAATLGNSQIFDNGTNVGIGTTSPIFTLDVQAATSNIRVSSSVGTNRAYTQFANTGGTFNVGLDSSTGAGLGTNAPYAGTIMHYGNYPIVIGTNATERVRISDTGRVGIGTTSPSARLEVNGNMIVGTGNKSIGSWPFFISDSSNLGWKVANSSGAAKFELYVGNSGINQMRLLGGVSIVGFSQDLSLGTSAYLNTVNISNTNGNVGIGNTSPTQKLDVTGNIKISNNNSLMFRNAANNADISIIQLTSTNQLNLGTTSSSVPSVIALHTNSAERMRITSTGNVGIGTTAPTYRLQVSDTIASVTAFGNFTALQSIGGIGYRWTLANDSTFRLQRTTDGFSSITTPITITSLDRVGIVNTTPSYPLHVSAQVSNISIYADYDIVAYSDQSVKENIRPIENTLERVIKSRGVLYDRTDSGEKNNIGFIAQELEVAFPELVVTNEDGTKAVKYQNAVAVLFEAIKEQQKQIDELKQIINGITK